MKSLLPLPIETRSINIEQSSSWGLKIQIVFRKTIDNEQIILFMFEIDRLFLQ